MAVIDMDEWGRDPSVQAMRKVFKGMETSLEEILEKLDITPYDHRIRRWLEKALVKFESAQTGIIMNEQTAPVVYAHCLAKIIASEGIEIREGVLPADRESEKLINEVFK
jgi:vacuolar-type H+-ATPase subunit E/Vma4